MKDDDFLMLQAATMMVVNEWAKRADKRDEFVQAVFFCDGGIRSKIIPRSVAGKTVQALLNGEFEGDEFIALIPGPSAQLAGEMGIK